MPRINLLPPEYKVEQKVNLNGILIKIGIFALAAIITYSYIAFNSDFNKQKAQLTEIENSINTEQPVLARVYNENMTRQELEKVDIFVQGLESNRVAWSQFITEIKDNTPDEVILTEISTTAEDGFIIRGEAAAFSPVGILYLNLKGSTNLAEFSMLNITRELSSDLEPVIKFELNGQLRKGDA